MRTHWRTWHGWRVFGATMLVGHLALTSALAQEQQAAAERRSLSESERAALDSLAYVPRDFGRPPVTEAGGARGLTPANTEPPAVFILASPKVAYTLTTQPTLYWYALEPSSGSIHLTLHRLGGIDPVLDVDLDAEETKGLYAASLADYGIRLDQDSLYQWSIAPGAGSNDSSVRPSANAIVATAEADPQLLAKIKDAPALAQVKTLAAAGYWYDALDKLSQEIATGDESQPWHALRAELLEQAGLDQAAAFDRAGGRAQ
jgi:Domain of Unknown Function (DUF928)